jgi:hypothetical protein
MPPLGLFFARWPKLATAIIDAVAGAGYLATRSGRTANVTEPDDQRIAREEQYWTTPRLLILGFSFLGVCLVVIYAIATLAFAATEG